MSALVPIHPVATTDPTTVRWVVAAEWLPSVRGPVERAPDPLQAWLDDGRVVAVVVDPDAVVVTLDTNESWATAGPQIRRDLHEALHQPAGWVTRQPAGSLRRDAESLIGGVVGQVAASHGGSIELVDVADGVVTVKLSGACHGCAAASVTLHDRLEEELRRRHPELREVRAQTGSARRRVPGLFQIGRRPPEGVSPGSRPS